MAKTTREVRITEIAIEDLVGSKGTGHLFAQGVVTLSYERFERGAPCKVRFHRGDEFNGVLAHGGGYLAVNIRGDADLACLTLFLEKTVDQGFRESNYVSRGALTT